MKLSIIIPTHGRPENLDRLLKVLVPDVAAYECGTSAEIIIVDDGGDAASRARLDELQIRYSGAPLNIHFRARRGGPSAARNSGIAAASGSVLAFLDDDCLPQAGYAAETVRLHEAYPDALLINGNLRAIHDDSYSQFWFHYYDAVFNGGEGEFYRINRVSSGHFSIKRPLLDRLSPLFDEDLPSREDYDLYLRLDEAGIPVYKADTITALIECRRSLRAFLRQRAWYRAGEVHIRRKYGAERVMAEQARHRARRPWRLWHLHVAVRLHQLALYRFGGLR